MAGHVFISHGSENSEEANALCAFIEGKGVKCWIAPRDVRPGIDYSEELQAAIEGCAAFVVLVTDMANRSPYVRAETEMAFSCHKPIFPVRQADIKPAAGLALFLKIRHWTDAFGKHREAALERLGLELQTVVGNPVPAPATMPSPPPAVAGRPRGGWYLARWQAVLLVLFVVGLIGGAVFLATRPGQKPDQNVVAGQPAGPAPRTGTTDNPLAATPGLVPGTVPGIGPNGEVDERALRNAIEEARDILEQQGAGRDPLGEALSVPTQ